MKRNLFPLIGLRVTACVQVQEKNLSYKFYGQVHGGLFYNSCAGTEAVDGSFHLYPKDVALDTNGEDLNASPNDSSYLLYSRLGIDVQGPKVGSAKTSLRLKTDFRGSSNNWAVLRIRHAYVNLDRGKSAALIGQTRHPLFGEVFPQMLDLSTGAPFQPFNCGPRIRYRYTDNGWQLTGSVLQQLQYLSAGPGGRSEGYIKNSYVPEVYLEVDYKKLGWQVGVGMEILSLVPKAQNEVDDRICRVSEQVSSVSGKAHVKYRDANWLVMARTLLASNLTQTCILGGYGITSIDPRTDKQECLPYFFSTSRLNVMRGKKWESDLFLGYLKNLGTNKALVGRTCGVGPGADQVSTINLQLSYNLPHWKLDVEYNPSIAWYDNVDL